MLRRRTRLAAKTASRRLVLKRASAGGALSNVVAGTRDPNDPGARGLRLVPRWIAEHQRRAESPARRCSEHVRACWERRCAQAPEVVILRHAAFPVGTVGRARCQSRERGKLAGLPRFRCARRTWAPTGGRPRLHCGSRSTPVAPRRPTAVERAGANLRC
jgi:hypothetical protein